MSKQGERIMALATVAIAINAAIQGIVAIKDFADGISTFTEIGALLMIGIFAVIAALLAIESYRELRKM